jgi:hypothetical protein
VLWPDPPGSAIASAEIAFEHRRGADYVRVTIVMTIDARDVADALAIAWDAFTGAPADGPRWLGRNCTLSTPSGRPVPDEPIDKIVIGLTQGNLNNSHVYLRQHLSFFPADAIGAADARDGQGVPLTVHFAGLSEPAETDIAGGKDIFRSRGPWRKFFAHHALRPGDTVIIERLSAHEYRVVPGR